MTTSVVNKAGILIHAVEEPCSRSNPACMGIIFFPVALLIAFILQEDNMFEELITDLEGLCEL